MFSVGPAGSRKERGLPLSGLRNNPWSTSLDSGLKALPIGVNQPKTPSSQYLPMTSSSLFENNAFSRPQGRQARTEHRGNGLGAGLASSGLGPTIWEGGQPTPFATGPKPQAKRLENPDSLFSFSAQTDEAFPGMPTRQANNWVNFLDRAGSLGTGPPQPGLSKTVSEIWDSGTAPLEGDGWSVYDYSHQLSSGEGKPLGYEAEPVDALFKGDSSFMSSAESPLPWSQTVPQLWGNSFLGAPTSTSETLPVSSGASGFTGTAGMGTENEFTSQAPPTSTFGALGGGSIWGPTPWSSANN